MIRLRQKRSEEARKNKKQKDCVNLIGCASVKHGSDCSLDKLQMEGIERRLVRSSSTKKPVEYIANGMWAHEWLNISHSRPIFLTLEDEEKSIQVFDRKGDVLRSIYLRNTSKLTLKVNKDVDHSR